MKILYICNEYPPFIHGGIGSFTRDIAEGLALKGHDVTVWGLYDTVQSVVNEKINGVTVVRNSYSLVKSRFKHLYFVLYLNRKLNVFLKGQKFDIIECQEWQGLLPLGLKHPGYVVRLHGASVFFDKLLHRRGNRIMHWLEKLTIKKAKNIVAVSDYCGKVTLDIVGLKKKYTVIYNAINKEKLNKYKNKNFNSFSIVFANSVLPKKGIFELTEAFNMVHQKFPDATLTIVGKLGYEKDGVNVTKLILDKLNSVSVCNVNITGWLVHANDVYRYLANAHICCYPSHMEGFGIAPLEGMALGKPVLYMNNGPGPEVIEDGISGILADCKNSGDIAAKIIEVFEGYIDINIMGANAEKRVEKLFDLHTVFIPQNIAYYKNILGIKTITSPIKTITSPTIPKKK